MILVESDNDLATCVLDYFGERYDVTRVVDLEAALVELQGGKADVLFADIGSGVPARAAHIESARRDHPELKIVVTYLALPSGGGWDADVLVRKPYSILEVDRMLHKDQADGKRKDGSKPRRLG